MSDEFKRFVKAHYPTVGRLFKYTLEAPDRTISDVADAISSKRFNEKYAVDDMNLPQPTSKQMLKEYVRALLYASSQSWISLFITRSTTFFRLAL